jgi:hypothetical protein
MSCVSFYKKTKTQNSWPSALTRYHAIERNLYKDNYWVPYTEDEGSRVGQISSKMFFSKLHFNFILSFLSLVLSVTALPKQGSDDDQSSDVSSSSTHGSDDHHSSTSVHITTTHTSVTATPTLPAPKVQVLYGFPSSTWIENLYIRSNDHILITTLFTPTLYQLSDSDRSSPILVHDFSGYNSLLGIAEGHPDFFYVVTCNFSSTTEPPIQGTVSVWEVDLTKYSDDPNPTQSVHHRAHGADDSTPSDSKNTVSVRKVASFPGKEFLNGLASLTPTLILAADSVGGQVFSIDITTGDYSVVIKDDLMAPSTNKSVIQIGINGLHVHEDYLYFTNTGREIFCRVLIDLSTGKSKGAAEIVTANMAGDDFAIDADGIAYVAENPRSQLTRITPDDSAQILLTDVLGPTAVQIGRDDKDSTVIYISTWGGVSLSGAYNQTGQLIRVEF